MNIFHIAVESVPFAKVGGLADVVGTLPAVLRQMGHEAAVILPHHGAVDDLRYGIQPERTFTMPWNEGTAEVEVSHTLLDGVPYYFIRAYPFFAADEKFIYSPDEGIDVGRFLFFCTAALEFVRRLSVETGTSPDIFHAHDWHTGTLPFLLRRVYYDDPILSQAAIVFSIHNMQYQGYGIGWHLERAKLPFVEHPLLHAVGKHDNCLALGLAYSTVLSTVSPRYAQEIVSGGQGYGLEPVLQARQMHLAGILNGIDTTFWNPALSEHIPVNYSAKSIERRIENKLAFEANVGFKVQPNEPLVGCVTRLSDQKGIDILIPAVRQLLATTKLQFVLLGTGAPHYEAAFRQIEEEFSGQADVFLTFNNALAQQLYAAIDIFLMPSLFEPCGIGQMIAMRYGALPVVREVGGLADTVGPDVGFLFADYHPDALRWAITRALDVYYKQPEDWRDRQKRAMQQDFSWERSVVQYEQLYLKAQAVHRSYVQPADK